MQSHPTLPHCLESVSTPLADMERYLSKVLMSRGPSRPSMGPCRTLSAMGPVSISGNPPWKSLRVPPSAVILVRDLKDLPPTDPADKIAGIFFQTSVAHGTQPVLPVAALAGVSIGSDSARRGHGIVVAPAGRMAEELHQRSPKPSMRREIHSPRSRAHSGEDMNHRMGIFMGHRRAKGLLAHTRNNGGVESKNPTPLPPFPSGHKESRPQPRNIEADLS